MIKYCKRKDVIFNENDSQSAEQDDSFILLDPRSGDFHLLNKTAFIVWKYCDNISFELLLNFVVKYLNIADEEISEFCADLHSILDEMVEKQLVIMELND